MASHLLEKVAQDGTNSLRERVYRHLEAALREGQLHHGTCLDQDRLCEELAIPQFPSAHGVLEVLIDTLSEGIDFWFLAKGGIFDDLFRMFHPRSPVFFIDI